MLVLTNLYIRNFAIIEELEIGFQQGLTIITGETGAGKSILMGALSLILGERADSQSLYNPAEKCIIEGSFDISQLSKVKNLLVAQDFEVHHELIIRRELNAQGRSRVFINDTPTTLAVLVPIATLLIDMHRQFDTIELQQSQYQLELIDELAKNEKELIQYQTQYQHWKSLINELDNLRQQNKLIKQELDYNQFLYNELEELNLQEEELEQLEQTYHLLSNSETLKSDLQKAVYQIQGEQDPVTIKLKACIQLLESHSKGIQVVEAICSRLQSVFIEVKDIGLELEQLFESTNFDQAQIDQVAERLSEGNRLLKKHHVQTTQELLELRTQLELKINQAVHADDQEEILNKQIEELFISLKVQATNISLSRKKQIPGVEKKVNELLKKVGMPNAMMKIAHHDIELGYAGIDKVEFLFDANQAGKFQPVSKVASGGELSRLMLCIKSVLAHSTQMPTLVFDEIDTGISGETAIQVGKIMQALSEQHQLICITHLPQIAGKADQHIYIYKEANTNGELHTQVKILTQEERINVLAEMLSGKDSGEQARKMVKELMKP